MCRNIAISLVMLLFASCATLYRPIEPPTSQELELADYGAPPNTNDKNEMKRLVIRRLKDIAFFDPNSAEIEDCSTPEKSWEYDLGRTTAEKTEYFFGWKFLCDINVKNQMGGYGGFKRTKMTYKNGVIVESDRFQSVNSLVNTGGLPLFGNK